MINLEYPFKNEYILTHIKQIKKQLLLEQHNFVELKIAIFCGSTADLMKDVLELFLLNNNIKPIFYITNYNKYYEEAVFENNELSKFNPDICYIYTNFRNIYFEFESDIDEETVKNKIDLEKNKYNEIWTNLNKNYKSIIIQNNFEYPNFRLLGNKDIVDYRGFSYYLNQLNNYFYTYASTNKNFYICDINYISSCYGLDKWHNEKYYSLYKIMCDINAIPYISFNLSSIIKSIYGKNKKAIAVDLDNTMWGGIISEDGFENLKVGPETAEGEMYLNFQKYIKSLNKLGILLNIVSKNDEESALIGLEKTDGILKKEDFLVIKSNWDEKDKNIIDIANELKIGIDNFLFIDDNPFERELVKSNLNGIAAPNIEKIENYIKNIDKNNYFEITNITNEDIKKIDNYKQNILREQNVKSFKTYDEYLKSLQMSAVVSSFEMKYLDRITQLTNKSNQFNLTTKRYNITDIETIINDKNYLTLYIKLIDKFGDNGIVSLFIGKKNKNILDIDLFLMSCRVLKRKVEYLMMDEIVKISKENNIEQIKGYYYKTEKNKMVENLYNDFKFKKVKQNGNGDSIWLLDNVDNYTSMCDCIKII